MSAAVSDEATRDSPLLTQSLQHSANPSKDVSTPSPALPSSPSPRSSKNSSSFFPFRFSLIDSMLFMASFILLAALLTYIARVTRLETYRISNVLHESSSAGTTIARRARPVTVVPLSSSASPEDSAVSSSLPQPTVAAAIPAGVGASSQAAAGRHLLSAEENAFAPFRDESHMYEMTAQWHRELKAIADRNNNPQAAFTEFLGPAVNRLSIEAAPIGSSNYCIAGFDGREDMDFIFTLKNTFHLLGGNGKTGKKIHWSMVLFVTPQNEAWFVKQLQIGKGLPGEHIRLYRTSPIEKRQANSLAASRHFYEAIPCEHIVYVQPDAFMLRSTVFPGTVKGGPDFYDMIHHWVFIGAPWSWCGEDWCRFAGNGGASFRRKSAMLDLTRHIECGDWRCDWVDDFPTYKDNTDKWHHVEDTYFSKVMHARRHKYAGLVPRPDEAEWYSVESKMADHINPWFVHKIWNYIPSERWLPIMSRVKMYYPESWQ